MIGIILKRVVDNVFPTSLGLVCVFKLNLTLLLSLLVTGGSETTALVESLTTAYSSAPSTRLKYLQRQKRSDCSKIHGVNTCWCFLNKITQSYHTNTL